MSTWSYFSSVRSRHWTENMTLIGAVYGMSLKPASFPDVIYLTRHGMLCSMDTFRVKIFAVAEGQIPQCTLTANVTLPDLGNTDFSYTFSADNNWVTANNNMTLGTLPHIAEKSYLVSGVVHTGALAAVVLLFGLICRYSVLYLLATIFVTMVRTA